MYRVKRIFLFVFSKFFNYYTFHYRNLFFLNLRLLHYFALRLYLQFLWIVQRVKLFKPYMLNKTKLKSISVK